MRGEILASVGGALTGYFEALLTTGYAQKSVYLGNEITAAYTFFYDHPTEAAIANTILFAILFAGGYNVLKNVARLINDKYHLDEQSSGTGRQ